MKTATAAVAWRERSRASPDRVCDAEICAGGYERTCLRVIFPNSRAFGVAARPQAPGHPGNQKTASRLAIRSLSGSMLRALIADFERARELTKPGAEPARRPLFALVPIC